MPGNSFSTIAARFFSNRQRASRWQISPEPSPPVPHFLMTDFDPAFRQKTFNVAQRQRGPAVEYHREADDFKPRLEAVKRGTSCYHKKLPDGLATQQPVLSDSTTQFVFAHKMPSSAAGCFKAVSSDSASARPVLPQMILAPTARHDRQTPLTSSAAMSPTNCSQWSF